MYVGGEFVRSESGRYDEALDRAGKHLANVCRGSRKDLRDAVVKARAAQPKWGSATPCLRGQILYRMAEMLEGRLDQMMAILRRTAAGPTPASARREVRAAIDRIVHHAGWTDKYGALLSSVDPVASSYFDFSLPEPMGVVGVLNLLSGRRAELVPHLACHMDVNALALAGLPPQLATEARRDAAVNVKCTPAVDVADYYAPAAQGLGFIRDFVEIKTTWHPVGR